MKENFGEQLDGVGIEDRESDQKFSKLVLAAREKAEILLGEASMEKDIKERLEMEKRAYTIFAALDALGVEVPVSIKRTKDGLVEKKRIVGFSSEESAKIFLKDAA
jgi:hypothetical protein